MAFLPDTPNLPSFGCTHRNRAGARGSIRRPTQLLRTIGPSLGNWLGSLRRIAPSPTVRCRNRTRRIAPRTEAIAGKHDPWNPVHPGAAHPIAHGDSPMEGQIPTLDGRLRRLPWPPCTKSQEDDFRTDDSFEIWN